MSRKKIHYLPSAIDTDFYKPGNKNLARKKLGIKKDEKVVLYVGRIIYLKGSDFFKQLVIKNPDKTFIMVGTSMSDEFNGRSKNLKIIKDPDDSVVLGYYHAADICTFFSRTEGNPFVSREAMSCGIPVMVLEIESVKLFKPAIIVPPNINIINNRLNDFFKLGKKEKSEISKKSREFVVNEYSYSSLKEDYIRCFLN